MSVSSTPPQIASTARSQSRSGSAHSSSSSSTSTTTNSSFGGTNGELQQHPEWVAKCREILIVN